MGEVSQIICQNLDPFFLIIVIERHKFSPWYFNSPKVCNYVIKFAIDKNKEKKKSKTLEKKRSNQTFLLMRKLCPRRPH